MYKCEFPQVFLKDILNMPAVSSLHVLETNSLFRKGLTAKNSSWFSQVSVDSSTQAEKHVFNRQKYSYVYYQYWTFLLCCTGCCPTDCIYSACKIPSQRRHLCCLSEQFPGRVLDRAQVSLCILKEGRALLLDSKEFWWCPAGSQTPEWAVWRCCVWQMPGRIGKEEVEEESAPHCLYPVLED